MNRVIEEREEHLTTADVAARARGEVPQPDGGAQPQQHLLPEDFSGELRSRWDRIQTGFVDEPRNAVQQADELVAQAIKRLAETFATERNNLEGQWDRGDNVSTEDLRLALQKYRSFFNRLLNV